VPSRSKMIVNMLRLLRHHLMSKYAWHQQGRRAADAGVNWCRVCSAPSVILCQCRSVPGWGFEPVPAIAWIENSALLVTLIVASLVGLAVVLWWHWRASRAHAM